MKTKIRNLIISGFIIAAMVLFNSCEKEQLDVEKTDYVSVIDVTGDGITTINMDNLKSTMVETPQPDDNELDILLMMKEEEKLARDVYSVLYQKWGKTIFSSIAAAEDRHMDAVIYLLKYYGSADTLPGEPGVFTIDEIQVLYDDLVAKGSVSLEEAYMTGALIEEMDIKDLTEALEVTINENIIRIFENLLKGSRNHLRAFNRQITNLGLAYTPVYISQEEFDLIVNSSFEKGPQYRIQGNGQNHRNCKGNMQGDGQNQGNCQGDMQGRQRSRNGR